MAVRPVVDRLFGIRSVGEILLDLMGTETESAVRAEARHRGVLREKWTQLVGADGATRLTEVGYLRESSGSAQVVPDARQIGQFLRRHTIFF